MTLLRGLSRRWPEHAVAALVVVYAAVFATLSVRRHQGFFTARYDLGNMTQAVWSASRGELLRVTDPSGVQMSRLGAHVEPILGVFAPLWKVWPDPTMLLVVQAAAVATMAIPAFLLARIWLRDDRLAVAFAAVALLMPAVQWATLFDFHPVTLAAPLLLWAIWAAVARHDVTLALMVVLAAFTKEQVGLSVAVLGIWIALALGRRRAGTLVVAWGLAWTFVAVKLIIPNHSPTGANLLFDERYGDLGTGIGDVALAFVTRPWDVVGTVFSQDRGVYVLALLLPLCGLALAAPLLAAGALPDLMLNLLSSRAEQHAIEYHYSAVIAPFLLAAAIRGFATLRRRRPAWSRNVTVPVGHQVAALVAAGVLSGYVLGPLPFWSGVPGGSGIRADEFGSSERTPVFRQAVAAVPDDAIVSAGNRMAGHLSARRKVMTFPTIDDAEYVVIDLELPELFDALDPAGHAIAVSAFRARSDFTLVWERQGVAVFRRQVTS